MVLDYIIACNHNYLPYYFIKSHYRSGKRKKKVYQKHLKPGDYNLCVTKDDQSAPITGQFKFNVTVGEKEVYNNIVLLNSNIEQTICHIESNDFDGSELDKNGNAIVKVTIVGKNWPIGKLILEEKKKNFRIDFLI